MRVTKKTCIMIITLVKALVNIILFMTTNRNRRTTLRQTKKTKTKLNKTVSTLHTSTMSIIILSPATTLRHSISTPSSPSIQRPLLQHQSSLTQLCRRSTMSPIRTRASNVSTLPNLPAAQNTRPFTTLLTTALKTTMTFLSLSSSTTTD